MRRNFVTDQAHTRPFRTEVGISRDRCFSISALQRVELDSGRLQLLSPSARARLGALETTSHGDQVAKICAASQGHLGRTWAIGSRRLHGGIAWEDRATAATTPSTTTRGSETGDDDDDEDHDEDDYDDDHDDDGDDEHGDDDDHAHDDDDADGVGGAIDAVQSTWCNL
eukprot:6369764-Pyramimonas_sp.AAC.1